MPAQNAEMPLSERIGTLRVRSSREWGWAAVCAGLAVGCTLSEVDAAGFHDPKHALAYAVSERIGLIIFGGGNAGVSLYFGLSGAQAGREATALVAEQARQESAAGGDKIQPERA